MSNNNPKKYLNDLANITLSETDKDGITNNSMNIDQIDSDMHNSININKNKKEKYSKKNYLNDSSNSEGFNQPKNGLSYEVIKKYEKKLNELNDQYEQVSKELKKTKRGKSEAEQELRDAIYEKEKLERKHETELNRLKEKKFVLG
jgi:hypothetical protein